MQEPPKLVTGSSAAGRDGNPSSALGGCVALEKRASVSPSVRWAHSRSWQGGSEDGCSPTCGRDEFHSLLGCPFPPDTRGGGGVEAGGLWVRSEAQAPGQRTKSLLPALRSAAPNTEPAPVPHAAREWPHPRCISARGADGRPAGRCGDRRMVPAGRGQGWLRHRLPARQAAAVSPFPRVRAEKLGTLCVGLWTGLSGGSFWAALWDFWP